MVFFSVQLEVLGPHLSDCTGETVTLTWENSIDQPVVEYSLSATPPVGNCDPNCTTDMSTTQFTFSGLEAEVRYNLTLRADNCGGTQKGVEHSFENVYIPSE